MALFHETGVLKSLSLVEWATEKELSLVNLLITVFQPDQAAMDQLKRRLGQTILTLYEDILCLQKNYRLLKDSGGGGERQESLKKSTEELEDKVYQKKKTLEDVKIYLQNNTVLMEEKLTDISSSLQQQLKLQGSGMS